MAALRNKRHEAFCVHLVSGKCAADAVRIVYPKTKDANSGSTQITSRPDFQARMGELKAIVKAEVLARLRGERSTIEYLVEASEPEFVKCVDYELQAAKARAEALMSNSDRVVSLIKQLAGLEQARMDRGRDQEHKEIPGIQTGFVVVSYRKAGEDTAGKHLFMKEHRIDIALSQELRAIKQQIAIELGQWISRGDYKHQFNSLDEALAQVPREILESELIKLKVAQEKKEAVQ